MKSVVLSLFALFISLNGFALEVHGHRGARARRPENTIPAFAYAIEAGAQAIELDLQVTRDGVLVVSHDDCINSDLCLGPDGRRVDGCPMIHDLLLSEVQSYDCGSLKNPDFKNQVPQPGTRIPTLDQVFRFVKTSSLPGAASVLFNIETKFHVTRNRDKRVKDQPVSPQEFVRLILEKVREHELTDRVILESFDYRTLVEMRLREPRIQIAALTSDTQEDLRETADGLKPDYISPHTILINRKTVAALHQRGVKVLPWTVNKPSKWEELIQWGVDGIITDDPKALVDYLKARR